jgi:MraZ protein
VLFRSCLALWSPERFEEKADMMETKFDGSVEERNVARMFFANAQEANPDRQGRVALSPKLRRYANLAGNVTVTGCGDHVEIWDAATWEAVSGAGERELKAGTPKPLPVGAPAGEQ